MKRVEAVFGVLFLLATAAGWGPSPARAQEWRGPASVGVEVRDKRGPIAGAKVVLRYREAPGTLAALTDSRGRAAFVDLAAGAWNVEVGHEGHLSYVAAVLLEPGRKADETTSFLQATGSGREPIRVKYFRAGSAIGTPVEAPAPMPGRMEPPPAPPAPAPEPEPEPEPVELREPDIPAPSTEAAESVAAEQEPEPEPAEAAPPTLREPDIPAPGAPAEPAEEAPPPVPPAPEAEGAPEVPMEEPGEAPAEMPEAPDVEPSAPPSSPPPAPRPRELGAPPAADVPSSEAPSDAAATPPAEAPAETPPVAAEASRPPEPEPPAPEPQTGPEPAAAPESPAPAEPESGTDTPAAAPESAPAPEMIEEPEPAPTPEPPPTETEPMPEPAPMPEPPAAVEPEPMPEPPAADEPETMPEPEPEPAPEPEPEPPAEPPAAEDEAEPAPMPRPEPPRSPSLRAFRDRSCVECKPGEWAVASVEALGTAGAATGCPADAMDRARAAARLLARAPEGALGGFAGPAIGGQSPIALELVPAEVRDDVSERLAAATGSSGSCRVLAVALPPGSRFTGFRYEASDSRGQADCVGDQDCPIGESGWHGNPGIERGAEAMVIYAVFENRSTRYERRARMTAYFVPPANWR